MKYLHRKFIALDLKILIAKMSISNYMCKGCLLSPPGEDERYAALQSHEIYLLVCIVNGKPTPSLFADI